MTSLDGFRQCAQQALDASRWSYLSDGEHGGDADAFAAIRIMPRPLRGLRNPHTRLTLFGQTFDHPLLLAPVAYQRLFNADGETGSALAAAAQRGQSIVSSLASQSLAAICAAVAADASPMPWFQLYWQQDRARTARLLERAVAAGCSAVVLTVDAPVKRATLTLPGGIAAVNLESSLGAEPDCAFGWAAQAPSWDDLAWLRRQTALPLLVKGILDPDDAQRAVDTGCDGIVVSSHGGRVLTQAPHSIAALPVIARRLNRQVPLLVDSGIRSGSDALVALALGATAVCVGRPYIWGLAAGGALGVAQVIRILRDELEMTMALAGCATLDEINPDCLAQVRLGTGD